MTGCQTSAPVATGAPHVEPRRVELADGVIVWPDQARVEVPAIACLDAGWLEQIACSPGTREHESLLVVKARPSTIHAALLLGGFSPGKPGAWRMDGQRLVLEPPTGDRVSIDVRYRNEAGQTIEEPIRSWVVDPSHAQATLEGDWIFGGSVLARSSHDANAGDSYLADRSGSIIGLVTFGDEVIGFGRVIPDEAAVQEPEWQVRTDHVPRVGTPVTIILWQAPPTR